MKNKYIILCILLSSCSLEFTHPCTTYNHYDWGFDYDVYPSRTTDNGILLDDSGQSLDQDVLNMIDIMTEEVIDCLDNEFPNGDLTDIKDSGYCPNTLFDSCPDKSCLHVKIPSDWEWSNDQQLLQDLAPDDACVAKGLTADSDNPCKWRGGLQDGYAIITTPNLIIYKDPLIKFITGCDSVWYEPRLAKCAHPGVEPLWNEK